MYIYGHPRTIEYSHISHTYSLTHHEGGGVPFHTHTHPFRLAYEWAMGTFILSPVIVNIIDTHKFLLNSL